MIKTTKMKRFSLTWLFTLAITFVVSFYAGVQINLGPKQTESRRQRSNMTVKSSVLSALFASTGAHAFHAQSFKPLSLPVQIRRNASFDYKGAMQKLTNEKTPHDDPRLVELIRNYYIVPPSTEAYDLQVDKLEYSMGQAPIVDTELEYMEGGFYVDCGACDGEWGSNTLFFERVRKWNGVLIEADPTNFQKLLGKHRKAFMINACLSSNPYPEMVLFKPNFVRGKIVNDTAGKNDTETITVQCLPLYSILLALDQLHVDFFSLDVEGAELNVLKSIPFDKVDIKMMAVEYINIPEGEDGLRAFGKRRGYQPFLRLDRISRFAGDILFKR